jgi:hypothetical protein
MTKGIVMDTTRLAAKIAAFAFSVGVAVGVLVALSAVVQHTAVRWYAVRDAGQRIQNNVEARRAAEMTRVLGGPTNFIEYEKAHNK